MTIAGELRRVFRGELLEGEPLTRHTSLKVGGPADLFITPADVEDLKTAVNVLDAANVPRFVIGGGYNLLVRDGGIRGAVISLGRISAIRSTGDQRITAEAGADNLAVVRFAQSLGLGGIGFMSGIPGTVGGAVGMNAGAYGKGLLERGESLLLLRKGEIASVPMRDIDFGYRRVALRPGDIVVALTLALVETAPEITEEEIRSDLELRRKKHAVGFPSAGSFFKNPPAAPAWQLIEQAGLRGTRVGGAKVSRVHANFLVNAGGATATDFLELAALVKDRVRETCGVELEEEVRIVGENR